MTKITALLVRWGIVPMTVFLLGVLVTRQLLRTRQGADGSRFEDKMMQAAKEYFAGNRTNALKHLERAAAIPSKDPAQHLELAGRFEALGQRQKAAAQMEQVLRLRPEARTAANFANLIEYCLEQGQTEDVRRLLEKDLTVNWPEAFETLYIRGVMALQDAKSSDDVALAIPWFQKCEALKADDLRTKIQLGIAYGRLGQFDKAEPLLRVAVTREPMNKVALFHLSQALRARGQIEEAEQRLKEHKRISELSDRQRYLEVQYSVGKYEPADLLELARIYAQFGQFKRAATTLRLYTRLKPADPAGHEELAEASLKLGDNETARIEKELAAGLKKDRPR